MKKLLLTLLLAIALNTGCVLCTCDDYVETGNIVIEDPSGVNPPILTHNKLRSICLIHF
jgi:hypothetical protein